MSDFEKVISTHCIRLYELCRFVISDNNRDIVLNRRFLGRFNLEATWMEETLDGAGARYSEKWFPFREGVSTIKLFSSVTYDLLHVKKSFKHYGLIDIDNNFEVDIEGVLNDLYKILVSASDYLIKRAKKCGIKHQNTVLIPDDFIDIDVSNSLSSDRKLRHIKNPGTTLIYLSTEFLNLKPSVIQFKELSSTEKRSYNQYIPDVFSEEKLRLVLSRFHNLQSLYDTYLSESDIEIADKRLKILRGHISFVYHMLISATEFSHYYERHIVPRGHSQFFKSLLPIHKSRFLEITIDFFMKNFICYYKGALELCHNVIDSYAEIGEKIVPIPEYRGFHVRPSSLVSKIVNYYGGRVKMILENVEYDPSTTLEIFRMNEEINAQKRIKLFELIHTESLENLDIKELLKILADKGVIAVYDKCIDINKQKEGETVIEYLKNSFAFLMASGRIDIKININVKFIGDLRSLNDIEILSKNGYGENKYGHNIALPKELSYLKR